MKLAIIFFWCACVTAQTGGVAPSFEVASVKRLSAYAPRRAMIYDISPTSLTLRNATLGDCLEWAYGYRHFQVVGPEWLDRPTDVFFDIVAKSPSPVSELQLKLMLQTLLKERLGFASHREDRSLPVYALVVDRGGPKLHKSPSAEGKPRRSIDMYVLKFENTSMEQFAETMDPPSTSRHVVDETGLVGLYDFTLDLRAYVVDPETGKSVFDGRGAMDFEGARIQALPKQLGLRLERKTAMVQVMVIDHATKEPTAN